MIVTSISFIILLHTQGLYGQNVLSQYSKAVDSAHSSVRVHSSRQSNDIIGAHGKQQHQQQQRQEKQTTCSHKYKYKYKFLID